MNSSQVDRSTNWWHQSNAATSKSGGANSHNLSPSAADDGRSYFRDYENLHAPKASNAGSDLGNADDRVKKFYGIIPKSTAAEEDHGKTVTDVANGAEIKTVRMVKRDSKERNVTNG